MCRANKARVIKSNDVVKYDSICEHLSCLTPGIGFVLLL